MRVTKSFLNSDGISSNNSVSSVHRGVFETIIRKCIVDVFIAVGREICEEVLGVLSLLLMAGIAVCGSYRLDAQAYEQR